MKERDESTEDADEEAMTLASKLMYCSLSLSHCCSSIETGLVYISLFSSAAAAFDRDEERKRRFLAR